MALESLDERASDRKSFDLSGAMAAQAGAAAADFNLMMRLLFPGAPPAELVRLFMAGMVCGRLHPIPSTELAMPIAVAARLDRHEIVVALSMVASGFDASDKTFADGYEVMIKGAEKLASRVDPNAGGGLSSGGGANAGASLL